MNRLFSRTLMALGTVAAIAIAPGAHAQGSSVYAQGACMTGTSGAGVAAPCADASAVFFNPAALVAIPSQVTLGVTAIHTTGEFRYDTGDPVFGGQIFERDPATVPVPHGYLNWRPSDRWAAAIGVFAPFGLGIEWPEAFEGRYVGYDNSMQALNIQPTVAYAVRPELLYVGGGVNFVRGAIEINQRLDAGFLGEPHTDYADVRLAGDGWGTTFHVGMKAYLTRTLEFGARYLHSVTVDPTGTAEFRQIPTGIVIPGVGDADAVIGAQFPADQDVATQITFPNMAVVGIAYRPFDALRLLADYQWTGWSTFRQLPIEFAGDQDDQLLILDYNDASTYRVGAEYSLTPALDLRAGFIYNTAATPDETVTPLLPEAERNYYTLGLGYGLGRTQIDLGYQYVHQAERRGRVRGRPDRTVGADELNRGVYGGTSHVLGITASYRFGATR